LGWVWSDELADSLRKSPEMAPLIPPSWSARPSAFATQSNEDALSAGRRLLGIVEGEVERPEPDSDPCSCQAAEAVN